MCSDIAQLQYKLESINNDIYSEMMKYQSRMEEINRDLIIINQVLKEGHHQMAMEKKIEEGKEDNF